MLNRVLACVCCVLLCVSKCVAAEEGRKGEQLAGGALNVVLILIDDLGWSDLGCYGSNYYRTPN